MSRRLIPRGTVQLLVPVLVGALPAALSSQSPAAPAAPSWAAIAPGGETSCATGSPYRFFVQKGDPARVLLFLMGGGACWDAETCITAPAFVPSVPGDFSPASIRGALDQAHPENPFRGYTAVFAPYCTGDLHLGAADQVYRETVPGGAGRERTIRHRGVANMRAVLDWMASNLASPQVIVVQGGSAGAIPAPFYGALLARRHPDARVLALADGAGHIRFDDADFSGASWGIVEALREHAEWEAFPTTWSAQGLATMAGRIAPNLTIAQIDYAADQTLGYWLERLNLSSHDLPTRLLANQAQLRAELPAFRSFTLGGLFHTVLTEPEFYTHGSAGVSVREWVTDLAAGNPVADVRCDTCTRPSITFRPADTALVDSVAALLATADRWLTPDAGTCAAQTERVSLRCAIIRGLQAHPDASAAYQEFFYTTLDQIGGVVPRVEPARQFNPIRRFNDAPTMTHDSVVGLIRTVRQRVAAGAWPAP